MPITPEPAPVDPGLRRLSLPAGVISLIVAAILMLAYNGTFWSRGADIFAGHPGQFIVFGLAVYALLVSFVGVFSFRVIVRPALAALLIVSAATSYYMDNLGVMIDRDMIQNVATTTFTESKHLVTFGIVAHVTLFGILPAAALFLVRVQRQRWLFALGVPVAMFLGGLAVSAALLMTNYASYASVLRERKDFMGSFQPGAPLVATIRYAKMMNRSRDIVVAPLGQEARKGPTYDAPRKPVLTIIVAGETARGQNFALNGYGVPTTPELAARDVINFTDVSSCGTATAVSLPCMFSRDGRAEYSFDRGLANENLLDVLTHAGFDVEWWDNNTGSKAVSARVPTRSFTNSENAEFCPTGECIDGIFMQHLEAFVPTITRDTVLVLHQIGSHGPTYHLRYPEGFARFLPTCETAEFKDCTEEEIRNAYDNTIAYTDQVLAETIDFLMAQDGLATSLLYVSDHGESLGEGGLYLHGAPYFMAPEVQTKVPMILWMSESFRQQLALDAACIGAGRDAALSHDNLFSTVLGLLDVETDVRDPDLDIASPCRTRVQVTQG
ncbi:phosphoethanolamine transferase [Jannaschia pohangensis]|uniref:Lipid A ethanolaminephosphotransferase n=1 Tax=Jannaschia pohangensis TaxID=390807 RepID=A0A1I3UHD2_9RHOB|nr:phosphoethanolamine--lipid A transferase [Jannaschia pohangensis]SFJ82332.1 lipid A ethanolaminephosphotransferase [Jannaschia pohangensis]